MTTAKQRHTRKKRRQASAVLRHGKTAKPTHKGRSGRTGSMHSKALASRKTANAR